MGASEWRYFVPYQADIEKAFQELRQAEFEAGNFYIPNDTYTPIQYTEEERWAWLRYGISPSRSEGSPKPINIDELFDRREGVGTGTILDMDHVWFENEFRAVAPLRDLQLRIYFGTNKPTHTMIDESLQRPWDFLDDYKSIQDIPLSVFLREVTGRQRNEGTYIIIYKDDHPTEIFFIGSSSD